MDLSPQPHRFMIKQPLFLIIDAMSQVFRAYYAVRGLSNRDGIPTNATYGFALMLNRVLKKFPPAYSAMVFDSVEPTHRHIRYPLYKATREKMPADLEQQIPHIKLFCEAMSMPIVEVPGHEADDVIGTIANRALKEGLYPIIVTVDKDLLQLVGKIFILNTSRDDLLIGPNQVKEIFNVKPSQIPDLLGLWGDASDNIPGAPGIGEKGAKALIQRFGSIEACLENIGELANKRQRESLNDNREQILMSKQLATIDTNVEIDLDWSEFRTKSPDRKSLRKLLSKLEFKSMLEEQVQAEYPASPVEIQDSATPPQIDKAFTFELVGDRVLIWSGQAKVLRVPLASCSKLFSDPNISKVTHNIKKTLLSLRRKGIELVAPYDDPMLMAYLLVPNLGKYELEDLVKEFFNQPTEGNSVTWIYRLTEELRPKITGQLQTVYDEIEVPLVKILADIECDGILLNVSVLRTMSTEMTKQLEQVTGQIYKMAGCEFNINSPKQLGEVLFEKLDLPKPRKLKKSGQYSTAVGVLEELAQSYELPDLILSYRQLSKFKSTYVDALPKLIDPKTKRLHTSLNQTGAATGRLSSSNPNLQNIPIRTEDGRKIRSAFIPSKGTTMLSADYSQIELRILAHLSGDTRLIEAFTNNTDIHRSTAATVLGAPYEQITSEERNRAKAVNFGIIYGQTPFGLSQQLGIGRDEAEEFIENYFTRYPGVKQYIENLLIKTRETGMTHTLFGRHRQIPEINSRNGMQRSIAERMAINAPIQGTAADIIKLAMIKISDEIRHQKLKTIMVLQVHDELIFEVPKSELEMVRLISKWMSEIADLRVPLVVDSKIGPTWKDLSPTTPQKTT